MNNELPLMVFRHPIARPQVMHGHGAGTRNQINPEAQSSGLAGP